MVGGFNSTLILLSICNQYDNLWQNWHSIHAYFEFLNSMYRQTSASLKFLLFSHSYIKKGGRNIIFFSFAIGLWKGGKVAAETAKKKTLRTSSISFGIVPIIRNYCKLYILSRKVLFFAVFVSDCLCYFHLLHGGLLRFILSKL